MRGCAGEKQAHGLDTLSLGVKQNRGKAAKGLSSCLRHSEWMISQVMVRTLLDTRIPFDSLAVPGQQFPKGHENPLAPLGTLQRIPPTAFLL